MRGSGRLVRVRDGGIVKLLVNRRTDRGLRLILERVSGLGEEVAAVKERFAPRLTRTVASTWTALANARRLRAGSTPPTLSIPPTLAGTLAAAIALEEKEGSGRGALLESHYLDLMPRLRVTQLATLAEPEHTLFHTPLGEGGRWHLPRLTGAVESLYAQLGADGERALGEPTAAAFIAARPTLAHLYERTLYGRLMPLLYGYPGDLAVLTRALTVEGLPLTAALDRHFAAPLVHELAHLAADRDALTPPYLDECVAGHLGVRAFPEFAFPSEDSVDALYHTYWLAQVGQALVRCFGDDVLRAHAGALAWQEAIGAPLVETAARLGWQEYRRTRAPHFLSDTNHPAPWLKLIFLARAGEPLDAFADLAALDAVPWSAIAVPPEDARDRQILVDALRMMCVEGTRAGPRPDDPLRARRRSPPPITIDLDACEVRSPGGPLDPIAPRHLFPPSVAARLRNAGAREIIVQLRAVEAIAEVADALLEGSAARRSVIA